MQGVAAEKVAVETERLTGASGPVQSVAFPYVVTLPEKGWYGKPLDGLNGQLPNVDRYYLRPARDAHVIIFAEQHQPEEIPTLQAIITNVLREVKSRCTEFRLL